ncbi:MAG TPA: ATP-dependent DNA ligase, partial [Verrucomicrobiae bacterium]|nr:ATP-dependent DNA ligase [Verrucomicrobiae bacterium]
NRVILEHAYNLSSDLGNIARLLSRGSIDDVRLISISLFTPIRPMLAERGSDAQDALKKFGDNLCFAEYKIDGERVQVHKDGKRLQLFTRNLENITNNFSDIVEEFKDLNIRNLIVDGEIVSIDTKTKRFLPFQSLMHRKRKYKIDESIKNYPVVLNLFDILFYDDKDKTILPYIERREILESIFNFNNEKIKLVCNSKITTAEEIDQFMKKAIADGCEGLMLKNSKSVYRTGAREWAWIKLKKEYSSSSLDTIDLTIVGAVHGKGRRAGNYGTFLLAAYNPDEDTFYAICKVGTGFTDIMLEELTEILKLHTIRDKHPRVISGEVKIDTWFEPKLVVEIFSPEITLSPLYPTSINKIKKGYGFALRFPKFTGKIRKDKNAEDSTTIHEIEKMYKKQLKSI